MAEAAQPARRARGFVLVLVVDERQSTDDHAAICRVAREYDVGDESQIELEVRTACQQACNQLALWEAGLRVGARRTAHATAQL